MRQSASAGLLFCLLMAAVNAGSLVSSLNQSPVKPHAHAFAVSSTVSQERKARIFSLYLNAYIITHKNHVLKDVIQVGRYHDAVDEWTIVTLKNSQMVANTNIAIRSVHGNYISAMTGSEGGRLELGITNIQTWENYEIIPYAGIENTISIRTYHGTWWSAPEMNPDICNSFYCALGMSHKKEWTGRNNLFRIEWI